ncbi:hypothetical protein [Streptomyces sp. NBC_01198]|uniref:hypothetical protein n=1 Tax=Streptomyces sp. NBC_01198 TaxID=2903769 RepID=UPI003FA388DA
MLDDDVDDVGGDQRQQPHRCVLAEEGGDGQRDPPPVGVEEVEEGSYGVLATVAVAERALRQRHCRLLESRLRGDAEQGAPTGTSALRC